MVESHYVDSAEYRKQRCDALKLRVQTAMKNGSDDEDEKDGDAKADDSSDEIGFSEGELDSDSD